MVYLSDILNEVYNLNKNSLAGYIVGADPHIAGGQELVFDKIQKIAVEQSAFVQEILDCMQHFEIIPHSFSFPSGMCELNYLSISYLRNVLLNELNVERKQMLEFIEQFKDEGQEDSQKVVGLLEKAASMLEQFAARLAA
jgi:hypothetical protein